MEINVLRIDTLLAEQGITKSKLAEKSGVSRQSISTILRRGTCTPLTAGRLAFGLGVRVEDILKGGN